MEKDLDQILLASETEVMIQENNWGHPYFFVRGEILGFTKEKQLPKNSPRVLSLIKNKS